MARRRAKRRRDITGVSVKVVDIGRPNLVFRFKRSGEHPFEQKTSGTSDWFEARTAAEKFREQLIEEANGKTTWQGFCERYRKERLSGKARKTAEQFESVNYHVTKHIAPHYVSDVDKKAISEMVGAMREAGLAEASIKGYLAHLSSALQWAEDFDIIDRVPRIASITRDLKGAKFARSRSVTREEFERMLSQLPKVVPADAVEEWVLGLEGYWRSGMRLNEALLMHWDRLDRHRPDNLDSPNPVIRIDAAGEKGKKFRTVPMTPDFADLLRYIRDNVRSTGPVFRFPVRRTACAAPKTLGDKIADLGALAGVITGTKTDGSPKFASAHDIRRRFATNWAPLVSKVKLAELMRHRSTEMVEKYYLDLEAEGDAYDLSQFAAKFRRDVKSVCELAIG